MAENQDKTGKSDEQKLAELEQQLSTKASQSKQTKTSAVEAAQVKATAKPAPPVAPEKARVSAKPELPSSRAASPAAKTGRNDGQGTKTGFLWFVTLVNLLILITVVGGAYWAWQQWQAEDAQRQVEGEQQRGFFSTQQQSLEQAAQANRRIKDELQQQNQALQSRFENLLEQVQVSTAQAQANKRTLADISVRRPSDWLLAEADYLVRMAGRKLWLEQDEKTAILMLQSADSRLQDMDDPSLLPIRQQLASDIQSLQQINPVSLSSIALAVGALVQQVDNLPLAMFKRPEVIAEEVGVSGSVDDWRTNLKKSWLAVTKDFFSVKRKQAQVQPFMNEQQQWLAREQLKLSLQQAKAAILKENNSLYQQSLQANLAQLIENFDLQTPAVAQFVASLQNLLDTDVERIYPGQLSAAPLLKDLIDIRMEKRFVTGESLL
ncbi:MAG: uroporphyrin-3 C-methyltransferase [Paraglaciecola sp.]|jgi:uroporphyrin-3 C-methyltransferase